MFGDVKGIALAVTKSIDDSLGYAVLVLDLLFQWLSFTPFTLEALFHDHQSAFVGRDQTAARTETKCQYQFIANETMSWRHPRLNWKWKEVAAAYSTVIFNT